MNVTLRLKGTPTLRLRYQPGLVGPAGTITVGTVTTGAAGSSVAITNSGTSQAAVLNFTIPRGATGLTGDDGWSPILAVVSDGVRRVLQIADWTGGEGTKPATGSYIGASGLVTPIASAVDIRGEQGPSGSVTDGDKGDITVSSSGTVWMVDNNAISDAKLRQSAGLSVVGRSANSTGNVADLTAGTDGHVLRRSGTSIGFGTVAPAGLDRSYLEIAGGTLTGGLTLARDARAALEAVPLRAVEGFIDGLTLSTDGANGITMSAGVAVADTMVLRLASSLTKQVNVAWSAGVSGCLDTGSEASATWYHVWIIGNASTGAVDFLASTSATSPTMPSGYAIKRRVGAVYNNGSSNIDAFEQRGDYFLWTVNPTPNTSSVALASASGTLFTLAVPSGLTVEALGNFWFADGVANQVYLSSPLAPDLACSATAGRADSAHTGTGTSKNLLTDTSSRIRARGATGTSGQIYIATIGWRDPRGRR